MEPKEFDNIINEALMAESKKVIEEQMGKITKLIGAIKRAQSLSGMSEKIQGIEPMGDGVKITINGLSPEELVGCCGGESLGGAQTNLMQGIHHDLDECGMGGSHDIDINTDGDDQALGLIIKITPNNDELSIENELDMNEQTDNGELSNSFGQPLYEDPKDENPTTEKDKDLILGDTEVDEQEKPEGNIVPAEVGEQNQFGDTRDDAPDGDIDNVERPKIEVDEQDQAASGAMAAEEDITEHHKNDKPSQITYICKNDKDSKKEDLEKLSDEEVEKKYNALEKKLGVTESKKTVVTLSERELETLIGKIISEAGVESPSANVVPGGVPGLDVTKKSHKDSGKENADALKAVEKKIRDYLSFDGNTDPEFPEPVGKGEQKVATKNTDSENDVVDLNRGRNPADLTYDQEPAEQFKERAKLSLVGASEMGNAQTDKDGNGLGNVVPSKTGDNISKVAEKRKQARSDEPIYDKEAVPVDEEPNKKDRPGPEAGNAGDATASEILRMKQLSKYKESTQ